MQVGKVVCGIGYRKGCSGRMAGGFIAEVGIDVFPVGGIAIGRGVQVCSAYVAVNVAVVSDQVVCGVAATVGVVDPKFNIVWAYFFPGRSVPNLGAFVACQCGIKPDVVHHGCCRRRSGCGNRIAYTF